MCGIIGYIGEKPALDILVEGLARMEYRGYDSAGVAFFENNNLKIVKAQGRLSNLEAKLADSMNGDIHLGIGHTRWATHGEPSDKNSHPHTSHNITVVHNGIIENYIELKKILIADGYEFVSETDTEVVAHLVDKYYARTKDMFETLKTAVSILNGSYALAIICHDENDRIYAIRKESPLLIGKGDGENFIASDMTALLKYTKEYYLLEKDEIAIITKNNIEIYDLEKQPVDRELKVADWDAASAEKGGFKHFMLKEIYDTPSVLNNIFNKYIVDGHILFDDAEKFNEILRHTKRIVVVACGSANYVGMTAKYMIESLCGVEVSVEAASEFRYRNPVMGEGDLVVAISQSGETADTLAAMRLAKNRGFPVLAIVNVLGSSVAREADIMIYTGAGPEISVATTKAFSAQLANIHLLALQLAFIRGYISERELAEKLEQLKKVSGIVQKILDDTSACELCAKELYEAKDVFFIGRGIDSALSLEGSLKLKEISYIHSEAFAAGELKHGPISLIDEVSPTVAISTQSYLAEKLASNVNEVRSRQGKVWTVCKKADRKLFEGISSVIELPDFDEMFLPIPTIVPLQLIAYYVALYKGCDIDKPRNLAKSVTVE